MSNTLVFARNQDGRLEIFCVGQDNVIYHNYQLSSNTTDQWYGQRLLETLGNKAKALAAGQQQDGRLDLFYIGTDDRLYHNWQTQPSTGPWSGEQLLGAANNKAKVMAI